MKIAHVDTHILRYPDPNDGNHERLTLLVRVETQDGVYGWGEAIAMWPEACRATDILIREGMVPLLVAAGEVDVAQAWALMRGHSWWYGVGGIASFAISAIDMALWDIAGKRAGLCLSDLVGGAARSRLPATASAHVNKATISACITEVAGYVERGFRSVKLGFAKKGESRIGFDPTASVGFITELRRALGDGIEILVDFGNGVTWDEQSRIDAIGRMTDCNIGWIEEPFHPSDLAAHRRLRESVAVPIATGEREWTVAGYERLIDSATVDIVGVDPARAEGITGFRAVDALVGKAGLTINAHAWSTAITTAASLHLSLASESTRLFELKPFPVVVQQDLVERPIWHRDGYVVAPKGTGLGVEIREGILHRYRIGP